MSLGRALAGALALVAVGVPSAYAGPEPVPAPSFRAATYVQGQRLPLPLVTGSWANTSTVSNQLTISGETLTGTNSTADATWTSSWGWTHPGKPAMRVAVSIQHRPLLPGVSASSWTYWLDERVRGGRWIGVKTVVSQPYDPVLTAQWLIRDRVSNRTRVYVQFRVKFHADINSTSSESMTVEPRLLTRT